MRIAGKNRREWGAVLDEAWLKLGDLAGRIVLPDAMRRGDGTNALNGAREANMKLHQGYRETDRRINLPHGSAGRVR